MNASLFTSTIELGPLVVLSGMLAEDEAGGIIGTDVAAQTRALLARVDARLRAAGIPLDRAASVFIHLKRAADFAAMNAAYAEHWPSAPPARTTIVCGLRHPDALVEMSVTAVREGSTRAVVHPAGWMASPNPYSYGILTDDTLLISGLVARNGRDNSAVTGDVAAQTRAALDNAGEILAAAGLTYRDVVSSRVFITEAADFAGMNAAYRTYFTADPPARATVVTPLTNPAFLVEITLIAVRDAARRALPFEGLDLPLSAAVQTTGRAFLSGALDESGATDAVTQTRGMIAEIEETMQATQLSWRDVREAVLYITDMTQRDAVEAELRQAFSGTSVAGVVLETSLVKPGAIVEMMVTAAR